MTSVCGLIRAFAAGVSAAHRGRRPGVGGGRDVGEVVGARLHAAVHLQRHVQDQVCAGQPTEHRSALSGRVRSYCGNATTAAVWDRCNAAPASMGLCHDKILGSWLWHASPAPERVR